MTLFVYTDALSFKMASHKDHDNKFYMSISQGEDNHPFDYFRALYGKFRDYRVQTNGWPSAYLNRLI